MARGEGAGFQVPVRGDQAQRLAGFGGQASGFVEEASADPAAAGDAAHAEVRQLPGVAAAPQQGGTQQAVVEAPGDQLAGGQPGRDQRRAVGMRGEQPVRCVGVDLRQVQAILGAGLGEGLISSQDRKSVV